MVAETGSVSRLANEICNLQILKGAKSAKSARMPKRSCKSLAKFILGPEGSRRRALVDESVHRVVFEVDAALQFVGNGLGVAIVPSALARTSADSGQIHSPRLVDQDPSIAEVACRNSYTVEAEATIWEEHRWPIFSKSSQILREFPNP